MAFVAEHWLAFATLAVLLGVFAGFMLEVFPPATVALAGVAVLLGIGALSEKEMLGVLSNSAPATIALMFVVTGALARVGVLEAISRQLRRRAGVAPVASIGMFFAGSMALSAFVPNTPATMVLIPVAIGLAAALAIAPSKLLMPLAFVTSLGGVCTLIGTSTNLLVDGVARDAGLPGFGLFDIAPVGIPVAIAGALYLALAGPYLLPSHPSPAARSSARGGGARFVLEALIAKGSPLAGKRLADTQLFAENSIRVIDVLRGDDSLRRDLRDVLLREGDRIVLRSDAADLESLRADGLLRLHPEALEPVQARRSTLMEALIGPGSGLVGRTLLHLRLRRRYGVYPIAVHRRGENLTTRYEGTPLEVADTLLLEGAPEDLRRLADDFRLAPLTEPPTRNLRPERAPIAVAAIVGVIVLASFDVLPLVTLTVFAVALLLLTRCVDADEAIESIEGSVLVLIYAMLAIGKALETTGAAKLVVDAVEPALAGLPTLGLLTVIFLLGWLLSELLTNNAVAVVLSPLVIELARSLGLDPTPLLVVVMVAASTSFATPIGYQTNMLVYGPGGYRFMDFVRFGTPLSLIVGVVCVLMVDWLYF